MSKREEERLWNRMKRCEERLQRITEEEASAAPLRTGAADGRHEPQRERLINQMEEILDQLEEMNASPTYEAVEARLKDELANTGSPVDVQRFVDTFYPHEFEAQRFLQQGFERQRLRGRVTFKAFECEGHISKIVET